MPASEGESGASFRVVAQESVRAVAAGPDSFTGPVTRADVLPEARPSGLRGNVFSYAPGARSHWHVHEGEQALVVVSGEGLVFWEGADRPRTVRPGDWIHVTPGVPHWHGASPHSEFVHLAVTASGGTRWLDPVLDMEYAADPRPSE
jgi:quercetin dioxygenase-like cupin family protein